MYERFNSRKEGLEGDSPILHVFQRIDNELTVLSANLTRVHDRFKNKFQGGFSNVYG